MAAAPAAAQAVPSAQLLISDGAPRLADAGSVRWRVCRPAEPCFTPSGSGLGLTFAPAPEGTRVEAVQGATVVRDAAGLPTFTGGTVVRSGVWQGSPVAVTGPALSGTAETGARVTVTAGAWAGGWGDGADRLEAIACPTPDGTGYGCRDLATHRGEPQNTFVVPFDLVGWYVRGVSSLLSYDMAHDTRRVRFPRLHPSQALTAPLQITLAPATVELRRRASRSSHGYGIGRVRCWARECSVTAEITGKRSGTYTQTVTRGLKSLFVPRDKRLKPGLWKVRVTVDGAVRADGSVRLASF